MLSQGYRLDAAHLPLSAKLLALHDGSDSAIRTDEGQLDGLQANLQVPSIPCRGL